MIKFKFSSFFFCWASKPLNPHLLTLSPHTLPQLLVLVLVHLPLPLLLHAVRPHGSRIFFHSIIEGSKPTFKNGFWEKPKRETGKDHGGGIELLHCGACGRGLRVTLWGDSENRVLELRRRVNGGDEFEG